GWGGAPWRGPRGGEWAERGKVGWLRGLPPPWPSAVTRRRLSLGLLVRVGHCRQSPRPDHRRVLWLLSHLVVLEQVERRLDELMVRPVRVVARRERVL